MGRTTTKHVPLRRCVACRASKPQAEMLRFTRDGDVVRLDLARRLGGRGTWVCRDCASGDDEKRLRQAFKGQAQQVMELLAEALAAHPHGGTGAGTNENNGGMNVR